MTTYNTGNPIGSTAVKDLYDNTENLDVLTNTQDVRSHPDRLGVERITWHGMEQRFIDLLASSGYEYIGDYAAGVEVTEYNQVIRDTSGEFWRVSGKTSLPYTTTGAGLPEGGAFVAVGDAALRQELAAENGALLVGNASIYADTVADMTARSYPVGAKVSTLGYYNTGDGGQADYLVMDATAYGSTPDGYGDHALSNGNVAVLQHDGVVNVKQFGADPSATDNKSALRAAIESGHPIDWGSEEYQVQGRVGADATLPHNIRWKSNGAKVVLDPSVAHVADVIAYRVDGGEHEIIGEFTVDASSKANICFGLRNNSTAAYPEGYATFKADGLGGINARRESEFRAGNCIRIEGAFLWVVLDNPRAKNAVLATGAGVSGSVGIAGITCSRDGDTGLYPLYTEINNPDIDGVESEDLTYQDDQDGVQVFGGVSAGDLYSSFLISGGQFRNCFGRSIKSQAATGTVVSPKFIRTRGLTSGVGNPEIDFQGGMGFVRDISCDYDGFVPSTIVGQRSTDVNRTQGLVDGVSVKITGGAVLPTIVSTFSSPPLAPLVVRNLSAEGPIEYAIKQRTPQAISYVSLEDFSGDDIREGLIQVTTGGTNPLPADYVGVDVRRAFNSGAPVRLVHQGIPGISAMARATVDNVRGFTGARNVSSTPSEADGPKIVKHVDALTMILEGKGGYLTMESASIADGATAQFPIPANGIAFFNAQFNHTSVASFGFSDVSGGRLAPLSAGSGVTVGAFSEPSANTFQIWPDTTNTLINVKNNAGSSRVVTLMYFVA